MAGHAEDVDSHPRPSGGSAAIEHYNQADADYASRLQVSSGISAIVDASFSCYKEFWDAGFICQTISSTQWLAGPGAVSCMLLFKSCNE